MIVKIVVGTSSYNAKQILIARKLKKKFTFIKKYKRENKELIPFKQNLVKSTKFKLIDAKFKLSKVIQAKKNIHLISPTNQIISYKITYGHNITIAKSNFTTY